MSPRRRALGAAAVAFDRLTRDSHHLIDELAREGWPAGCEANANEPARCEAATQDESRSRREAERRVRLLMDEFLDRLPSPFGPSDDFVFELLAR